VKRLRLVADRAAHPGIADEQVTARVHRRSARAGSTHLHALLALAQGVRAPTMWEMSAPVPAARGGDYTTDARIAACRPMERLPESRLLVRHRCRRRGTETVQPAQRLAFVNQALMASFDVPMYKDWFLDADYTSAYTAHLHTLQHLQWHHPGRWVLKVPKAPAVARRAAGAVPRRGAGVDAPRPCEGRAVRDQPHRLDAFGQHPALRPGRVRREWATIESCRCTAVSRRRPHAHEERHIDVRYLTSWPTR